jgi:hypothetical protein
MAVSSAELRPKSDYSGKAQKQLYSKLQTHPLVREGATKLQKRNCLKKKFQGDSKIGHESQMDAWHQDWLADWLSVVMWLRQSQRVRVTLQLTVSQSVSLGVEPNLGLLTRDLFFLKFLSCHLGAPSLTSGRVCYLSVYSQSTVVSQYLHKIFTYCVTHIWHLHYSPSVRHIYNKKQ